MRKDGKAIVEELFRNFTACFDALHRYSELHVGFDQIYDSVMAEVRESAQERRNPIVPACSACFLLQTEIRENKEALRLLFLDQLSDQVTEDIERLSTSLKRHEQVGWFGKRYLEILMSFASGDLTRLYWHAKQELSRARYLGHDEATLEKLVSALEQAEKIQRKYQDTKKLLSK